MCFSAMVIQETKELNLKTQARVQIDLYDDLFERRLVGEKILIDKAMEYPFTHFASTHQEIEIKRKINEWHALEVQRLETDLFKQKARMDEASRILATKVTKKAQEDQRIAGSKIEKLKVAISRNRSIEFETEDDQRIFPFYYVSMICLDENGEKIIRPVRYHMRPHNKDESFDRQYEGCYNARLDNLETVPWWKDSFGKRHGLMLIRKFYENVARSEYAKTFPVPDPAAKQANLVLCFEPPDDEIMFIPMLWDVWNKPDKATLYSAALITDDPSPEVAATGHNRTPISIKPTVVDDWLHPSGKSMADLYRILGERVRPRFAHRIFQAA